MSKRIMYEVHWHSVNGQFTHCSVTPIQILWEGVMPGCSRPSIRAVGADGRPFMGSADEYYNTEAEAWAAARAELADTATDLERTIAERTQELAAIRRSLEALP